MAKVDLVLCRDFVLIGGVFFLLIFFPLTACTKSEQGEALKPVPPEYANKRMPEGWWTDPKIIKAGQKVYEGRVKLRKELDKKIKCAECHGIDGKPRKRGARDFRVAQKMKAFSDSYWFWRVSEGVPKTKMESWKDLLTEEQIWQVIAYEHTFSHDGKLATHVHE
jgi:mono/diheme cytochrome c family protein